MLEISYISVVKRQDMQPIFKPHSVHQQELFPLNLNDLIAEDHSARLIDRVVKKLDIPDIISQYKGGGTSSYHPKMLLKILFYGYLNNTYSCRKLARAVEENIYFMWLSGGLKPDFRTINNFRGNKLRSSIEKLFSQENDFKEVIKKREIYQVMEIATDKCEDAANVIESIILKYA